jgi:membrane-bound inhibitor of C-type lysozyme
MPSVNLWPFGGESKVVERSRAPANATEYRCDGGKGFYLRTLEGGTAVWLIYPDRQVRLEKQTGTGTRYTNGVATLRMEEAGASLTDGPVISYHNCKVPAVVETKPAN